MEKTNASRIPRPLLTLGAGLLVGLILLFTTLGFPEEHSFSMVGGYLLMITFTFWPMLISCLLLGFRQTRGSAILLGATIAAYLAWFLYAYFTSFKGSSDGQAALVFIIIGFYSLPVMLPAWGIALWLRKKSAPSAPTQS